MNPASLIDHIGRQAEISSKFAVFLCLVLCSAVQAQSLQPAAEARMQASIARQMRSVEKMKSSGIHTAGSRPDPRAGFFLLSPPVKTLPDRVASECLPLPAEQVDSLVSHGAEVSSVSPDLLRAVMKEESGFRPCAVSSRGAMGLMQLMASTAEDMGVRNAFDPQENVTAGARFLKQLISLYNGDVSLALSAYNAGPERVDPLRGIPDIPETMRYVNKILWMVPELSRGKFPLLLEGE